VKFKRGVDTDVVAKYAGATSLFDSIDKKLAN
jgi:hypothetical protein